MSVNISNKILRSPGCKAKLEIDVSSLPIRTRNAVIKAIRSGHFRGGISGMIARALCKEYQLPHRSTGWRGQQVLHMTSFAPEEYIQALILAAHTCEGEIQKYDRHDLLFLYVENDTPALLPLYEQGWYQQESEPLLRMLEAGAIITCSLN